MDDMPDWVRKLIYDLIYQCRECGKKCRCLDSSWFWPDEPLKQPEAPFWR